jgi:hypothetical protein
MSLAVLADHMASKGRNGDTMLVHMAPEEVKGLHALAAAYGGELTINPETGLPEANFLKRLLPTIIGAALAATGIGAPMAALMVGGFEAVRTGDLSKGIMAGLGAYGGAGIGSALSSAGATTLAGSEGARLAAEQAGMAAAESALPADALARAAESGLSQDVLREQVAKQAYQEAARNYGINAPFTDRLSAGLSGLTEKAGRDAFMQEIGGTKGALRNAYMAFTPMMAAENVKAGLPQTTTQMGKITPYVVDKDGNLRPAGSYNVGEFPGFAAIRERYGAKGGLMGLAEGGVADSSEDAFSRGGMFDFTQRSEPVVRMANGGVTPAQLAAQQSILNDPQAAAFNEVQAGMLKGLSYQQIADAANAKYGKSFNAQNVQDFIAANPTVRPLSGIYASDPTQRATPTATQLAAQQSILPDPQAAALGVVRSGVATGLTNQQIADLANETYGKSFSAQNVADFMAANNIMRPKPPVVVPPVVEPPYTPPDLFTNVPGVAPGTAVTGAPAVDYANAPTMGEVRTAYEQGGGATKMPVITDIKPTDRTYTQNQTFSLLKGYLQANPNALYSDVVAFARRNGIPDMQAKAAYNEFRFSGLTGGSSQAYDYLMGRGAYPVAPFVPAGGRISRSYAEMMGLPTTFTPKNLKQTTTDTTLPEGVPKDVPVIKNPKTGSNYSSFAAFYFDANPDVREAYETQVKGNMSADDYAKYHYETLAPAAGEKEKRKGYYPSILAAQAADPATGAGGGGATGGLAAALAGGGMSRMRLMGVEGAAKTGGHLGDYSDGGRLLRGPGDGVSDSIPATIANKRPARLADGEFVVPARIVSELGNGSTEAGARKLYAMMDRVQAARRKSIGKGKVAKNSRADKHLPA